MIFNVFIDLVSRKLSSFTAHLNQLADFSIDHRESWVRVPLGSKEHYSVFWSSEIGQLSKLILLPRNQNVIVMDFVLRYVFSFFSAGKVEYALLIGILSYSASLVSLVNWYAALTIDQTCLLWDITITRRPPKRRSLATCSPKEMSK